MKAASSKWISLLAFDLQDHFHINPAHRLQLSSPFFEPNPLSLFQLEKHIPASKTVSVKVVTISGDLTNWESTQAAVREACSAQGKPITLLVCAVGVGTSGTFEDMDMKTIEGLMRTNWLAPVHLVKAALPSLKEGPRPAHVALFSSQAAQVIIRLPDRPLTGCFFKGIKELFAVKLVLESME